jgi:hypothetical protein
MQISYDLVNNINSDDENLIGKPWLKPSIGQRVMLSKEAPRFGTIISLLPELNSDSFISFQLKLFVIIRWLRHLSEPNLKKDEMPSRVGSICEICCEPRSGDVWCNVLWDEYANLKAQVVTGYILDACM